MFDNVTSLKIGQDDVSILKINNQIVCPKGLILYDYLENIGNSHIDIGFPMKTSYTIEGKLLFINGNSGTEMNGFLAEYSLSDKNPNTQTIFDWANVHKTNKTLYNPNVASWAPTTEEDHFVGNLPFIFKTSLYPNKTVYLNGNLIYNSSISVVYTPTTNSILFRYKYKENAIDGYGFKGRCYWCKIYDDNNALLRNFLPCTYNNVTGFWDTVTNLFFSNQGNDDFVVGFDQDIIQIPITSTMWKSSNFLNRTTSSINNNIYRVEGYLQEESIDTSFSITSNGFVYLPSNTNVILSFYCKLKSSGNVYFTRRYVAGYVGDYEGGSYGTSTGLVGISDSSSRSVSNTNTIDIGKEYEGYVNIPIKTHDDNFYKIMVGFDNPNLYGVGSFIEFSDVKITIPN